MDKESGARRSLSTRGFQRLPEPLEDPVSNFRIGQSLDNDRFFARGLSFFNPDSGRRPGEPGPKIPHETDIGFPFPGGSRQIRLKLVPLSGKNIFFLSGAHTNPESPRSEPCGGSHRPSVSLEKSIFGAVRIAGRKWPCESVPLIFENFERLDHLPCVSLDPGQIG